MKKIINGKRYDTDTALELVTWENMDNISDFHYLCETLYQKRTGEFFLYGQGGPMTVYAEPCGTSQWTSGERLMPMTVSQAKKWAEEHLTGDEYEDIFGIVSEGDSGQNRQITLSLDSAVLDKAERLARNEGVSLPVFFEQLIRNA